MEMVRMEAAMRTLGSCVPHAPERLVRNMTLTVRDLERGRARMAEQNAAADRTRETRRELQPKKHDPRKL